MSGDFVLDAGAFIAAERRWIVLWDHLVHFGVVSLVPAAVVREVWRGGPQIARVLAASDVVDLTHEKARAVGELCGTSNPVDASVALVAVPPW